MNAEVNPTLNYTIAAALVWTLLLFAACLAGRVSRKERWLRIFCLLATTAGGYLLGRMTFPSPAGYVASAVHSRPGGISGAVSGFLLGVVIVGVLVRCARIVQPSRDNDDSNAEPSGKAHSRLKELARLALICVVGWEAALTINAATFLVLAHDFRAKAALQSNTAIDFRFYPLVHIHRSLSILSSPPTRWMLIPPQTEFVVETREMIEDYHQYRAKNKGHRSWTPDELKTSPPFRMPDWVLRRLPSGEDGGAILMPLIFDIINIPAEYEDRAAQCLRWTIVSQHVLPH